MNYNAVKIVGTYTTVKVYGTGLYSSELDNAINFIYSDNSKVHLFVSEEKYNPKWVYCGEFKKQDIRVALEVSNMMIDLFKKDVEEYRNDKIKELEKQLEECEDYYN